MRRGHRLCGFACARCALADFAFSALCAGWKEIQIEIEIETKEARNPATPDLLTGHCVRPRTDEEKATAAKRARYTANSTAQPDAGRVAIRARFGGDDA